MIYKEDFIMVHELHKKGYSIHKIAQILKLNRRTVSRRLAEEELKKSSRSSTKISKLDPYKPFIRDLIAKSEYRLPWSALMDDISELGYIGGRSILQEFLTAEYKNLEVINEPTIRFETEPGRQAQADWTTIRSGKDPIYAFVITLGYSRMSFIWFTTSSNEDDLVDCLDRAFAYFNGVPQSILYDNMKDVVITRDAYGEGEHKFNDRMLDFAKQHGFDIKLCKPYRPQTKGKVERFNSYLKGNFYRYLKAKLKGTLITITANLLNAEVFSWMAKANKRIHGTTKERPIARFEIEHPVLLPYVTRRVRPNLTQKQKEINDLLPGASKASVVVTLPQFELGNLPIIQPSLAEYDGLLGDYHG